MKSAAAVLVLFACSLGCANCAKILAVVPTLSKSHYVMFEVLIKQLASRGHAVTAITTFPQENRVENLEDISLRPVRKVVLNNFEFGYFSRIPETVLEVAPKFLEYIAETEKVLNFTAVSDLINSNEHFDLIIYESFVDDVFLGFAHKFRAPVITVSTCFMFPWIADRFAIPASPAYVPGFYSGFSDRMGFLQRLQNCLHDVSGRLYFYLVLEPRSTRVLRKYFGPDTPPVRQLITNVSLYFVNSPFPLFGARSYPPQVVDISGVHLQDARPLPQELDKWMNDSVHGVIYFSFGSMLRGATLPADKVAAFLQVFGTLPQRVLWKWEDDTLDNLPPNVRVMKWLPQRDVLANPKVKVFISHGGLLGATEAIVSAVPILGIPMYGDQPNNVAALVQRGVAVHVDYNNISVGSVAYALHALLHDDRFARNAKLLSSQFLDRPQTPLETAVYWTEYVIRHRGAPHLQSAAVHLAWYQYYLLDVVAVCVAALITALIALFYLARACFRLACAAKSTKLKTN